MTEMRTFESEPPKLLALARKVPTALATLGGVIGFLVYAWSVVDKNPPLHSWVAYVLEAAGWMLIVVLGSVLTIWKAKAKRRGLFEPWSPGFTPDNEKVALVVSATNTFHRIVWNMGTNLAMLAISMLLFIVCAWTGRVFILAASGTVTVAWLWMLKKNCNLLYGMNDLLIKLEDRIRKLDVQAPFKLTDGSPPYSENSPSLISHDDIGRATYLSQGRTFGFFRDYPTDEILCIETTPDDKASYAKVMSSPSKNDC